VAWNRQRPAGALPFLWLTVGFVSVMILSVGSRVLPAFAAMRRLWSPWLVFLALVLLSTGCALRVSCEVLSYQGYPAWG